MFSGVADRYTSWEPAGEPYKEDGKWYIKMLHPRTKMETKVRFYPGKATKVATPVVKPTIAPTAPIVKARIKAGPGLPKKKFPGAPFGFESKDDTIIAIRSKDLTEDEVKNLFEFNWERGGKWKFGMFFGGIWYAPKNADKPAVISNKYFTVTWPEFVKAGHQNSEKVYGDKATFWQSMEV